jgi:photosystem II stability/assembly factor-like uncharacterized protein
MQKTMRTYSIFFMICVLSFNASAQISIKMLTEKKGVSLRALSLPNEKTIWASGSSGSIARSVDGGDNFAWLQVKGFEKRDFRALYAWSENEAIIVAVAAPAVILKTKDGGVNWYKVYENTDTSMFLDAIHFKDKNNGMIVGDPIDNEFYVLRTSDKGEHWQRQEKGYFKNAKKEGESFFASSNSNISSAYDFEFLVSGGKASRLWINGIANELPLVQGGNSTGANSIAISPSKNTLVIVGGDFTKVPQSENNISVFNLVKPFNFRKSINAVNSHWVLNNDWGSPHGYKSSIVFLDEINLLACGTSGVDLSKDGGKNWELISTNGFHVVQKQPHRLSAVLAGSGGRIALLKL